VPIPAIQLSAENAATVSAQRRCT